jgi:hypothetical protein
MSTFATNQGVNMKISKIALAAIAVIALSANAAPQHQSGAHGAAGHDMTNMQSMHKSSPNAAKAPYELQFLDTMAMHHQMAMCIDSWDHVPIRSWPLFKARNVLRTLFQSDLSLATR